MAPIRHIRVTEITYARAMEQMKRYAIYYAPEAGLFAERAAEWLGWDAATGAQVAQPDLRILPRPVSVLTAEPRKYGFHGTLKPPFRLAAGKTPETLMAGVAALAARLPACETEGLALTRLGRFLALCPTGDTTGLATLAAEVVRRLDSFRAPLTEDEIARRRPERLTPRQRELLDLWGYPYVMEEFRFHLTLTGGLEPWEMATVETALTERFAPVQPAPFRVNDLCLFGEAQDGRFHLLHRYALTG